MIVSVLQQIPQRRGATLTEVLMSLLIMSVGVLSVFSLYPIAVTRSIQATQAVHSKVLLGNAQAEILSDPAFLNGAPPWKPSVFYRIGDVVTAVPRGSSLLAPFVDRSDTVTGLGRFDSNLVAYFVCISTGISGDTEPEWPSVRAQDNLPASTVTDNGVVWTSIRDHGAPSSPPAWDPTPTDDWPPLGGTLASITNAADFRRAVYVVDPLGWATHHRATRSALRDFYGNAPRLDAGLRMLLNDGGASSRSLQALTNSSTLTVEDIYRPLFRVTADAGPFGGFDLTTDNQELTPAQLVRVALAKMSLDGSYEAAAEPIPLATGAIAAGTAGRDIVTLAPVANPEMTDLLSEWQQTVEDLERADLPNFARITLTSQSTQLTESRWLVSGYDDSVPLDGTTDVDGIDPAALTVEIAAVSDGFDTATDVTATFEVFEPRYSWLATFARSASGGTVLSSRTSSGGLSNATCVVFFRRPFENSLEVGFNAQIGNDPTTANDDPEGGSFNEAVAEQNVSRAFIHPVRTFVTATGATSQSVAPQVAVGRHLFDSTTGNWYRIESVIDPGDASSGDQAIVELDRPAEVIVRDPDDTLSATPSQLDSQVVIPQGIVRIFDLDLEL